MSTENVLTLQKRDSFGTGAARACRNAGMVPGVLYGAKKEPQGISIDPKTLGREFAKSGFFARVFQLDIDGVKEQALAKDVQLDPVTDIPTHIDFMRVTKGTKVHVHVPIQFINEDKAPALKQGGVLNIVHHRLEVIAPAESMPTSFTVDLAALDLSKGVHISDLKLAQGVVAAHGERDNTLATVVMPKGGSDEKDAE